jgi:hypothetical protein
MRINGLSVVRGGILVLIATYWIVAQPCHPLALAGKTLTTVVKPPARLLARTSVNHAKRVPRWRRRFTKWSRRKPVDRRFNFTLVSRPEQYKQNSTTYLLPVVQSASPGVDVVAKVGIRYIHYSDIECSENNAEDEFVFKFGRVPLSTTDLAEVGEIKQEDELQNLESIINQVVSDDVFVRRHLFITSYDMLRYNVPLPPGTSVYKMIDSMHLAGHQLDQVADGLQAVYQNGVTRDAAYKKYIAPSGDQFLWQVYVSKCLLPDQWNLLRKQAANDLSITKLDFERSNVDTVRHDKLLDYEDNYLSATDKVFAQDITLTHGYPLQTFVRLAEQSRIQPPSHTTLELQAEEYINQARRKWWTVQYNSANIKIYMPSLRPAMQDLLSRQQLTY